MTAILLAAGLSQRMGFDKLLAEYKGIPMLNRAVSLLMNIPAEKHIAVSTAERIDKLDLRRFEKLDLRINPDPQEGIGSSVRIGIKGLQSSHVLFLAADQPGLTPGDIIPMIDTARQYPDRIIYPVIDGSPCNPVIFPALYTDELNSLGGDAGGRVIRDRYPQSCMVLSPEYPERFIDLDEINDDITYR